MLTLTLLIVKIIIPHPSDQVPEAKGTKSRSFREKKQALFWATDRQGRDRPKRGLIYRVWARALMQAPLPPPKKKKSCNHAAPRLFLWSKRGGVANYNMAVLHVHTRGGKGGGVFYTLARAGL